MVQARAKGSPGKVLASRGVVSPGFWKKCHQRFLAPCVRVWGLPVAMGGGRVCRHKWRLAAGEGAGLGSGGQWSAFRHVEPKMSLDKSVWDQQWCS